MYLGFHQHRIACWEPSAPSVHLLSWSSSHFFVVKMAFLSKVPARGVTGSLGPAGRKRGLHWPCVLCALPRPPPSCLTHPVAAAMMHPPSAALAEQQSAESWLMPKLWPISWAMVGHTDGILRVVLQRERGQDSYPPTPGPAFSLAKPRISPLTLWLRVHGLSDKNLCF